MRATLFFDEADAATVCRVRPGLQATHECEATQRIAYAESHASRTPTTQASDTQQMFARSGSLALPEVQGVLFWWLETQPMVYEEETSNRDVGEQLAMHLMVVGDEASTARLCCSHARMATVLLPVTTSQEGVRDSYIGSGGDGVEDGLLTCGVVRHASCSVGSRVLVTWLTRRGLQPGYVWLSVRRQESSAAAATSAALVWCTEEEAGGQMMDHAVAPLHELRAIMEEEEARMHNKKSSDCSDEDNDEAVRLQDTAQPFAMPLDHRTSADLFTSRTHQQQQQQPSLRTKKTSKYTQWWSACVVANVGAGHKSEEGEALVYFVLTNGVALWRVALHRDGSHTLQRLRYNNDEDDDEDNDNEEENTQRARVGAMCHDLLRSMSLRNGGAGDGMAALQRIPRGRTDGQTGTKSAKEQAATQRWWSRWRRSASAPHTTTSSRHTASAAASYSSPSSSQLLTESNTPRRRYLAVTAIQDGGTRFALLRWNGLLECYDVTTMRPCTAFATGILPLQEHDPQQNSNKDDEYTQDAQREGKRKKDGSVRGAVRMWAVKAVAEDELHVFCCLCKPDAEGVSWSSAACYWSILPRVTSTRTPSSSSAATMRHEGEHTAHSVSNDEGDEGEEEECVALRATLEVLPPMSGVVPQACAVSAADRTLHILWQHTDSTNKYSEAEGGCCAQDMHTAASLIADVAASLALSDRAGRSLVQVVHATQDTHTPHTNNTTVMEDAATYFCRGVQDVVAMGSHGTHGPVLLERYRDCHRAYILQDRHRRRGGFALDAIEHLTSHTSLCAEEGDYDEEGGEVCEYSAECTRRGRSRPLTAHTLTAVPTLQLVPAAAPMSLTRVLLDMKANYMTCSVQAVAPYMAGLTAVQHIPCALAQLMRLLEDVLTGNACTQTPLAAVPRLLSEARLNGLAELYEEDSTVRDEDMQAALALVLQLPVPYVQTSNTTISAAAAPASFFSYSRTYILHTVCHALRARIVFLVLSYLGWMASGPEEAPRSLSALHDHLTCTLQMLVAAYHAAHVAGPELANLVAVCVDMSTHSDSAENNNNNSNNNNSKQTNKGSPWRLTTKEAIRQLHGNVPCILLAMLLPDLAHVQHKAMAVRFVVHVAYAWRRAGGGAASLVWATQLQSRFPLLQHYRLVHELACGRTMSRSTAALALCRRVCTHIAQLHDDEDEEEEDTTHEEYTARDAALACALLFDANMLDDLSRHQYHHNNNNNTITTPSASQAVHGHMRSSITSPAVSNSWDTPLLRREMRRLVHLHGTSCAATLYAVVLLRRVTVLEKGAVGVRLAMEEGVTRYLLPQLHQLRRLLHRMHATGHTDTAKDTTMSNNEDDGDDDNDEAVSLSPQDEALSDNNNDYRGDHTTQCGCPALRAVVEQLYVELSLALARHCLPLTSSADPQLRGRQGCARLFSYLQNALESAEGLGLTAFYAECVRNIFTDLLARAAGSPLCMHGLVAATIPLTALAELLVEQWYRYIASLPIQGGKGRAADARRTHSTLGLHRFLLSRHAYAQCAGVMTNLASLMRCAAGPPRRGHAVYNPHTVQQPPPQQYEAQGVQDIPGKNNSNNNGGGGGGAETLSRWVGYVAALALQAAELITPSAPMAFVPSSNANEEEEDDEEGTTRTTSSAARRVTREAGSTSPSPRSSTRLTTVASPLTRGLFLRQGWPSPTLQHPSEATTHSLHSQARSAHTVALCDRVPLLTRDDLPWLRRRVYQAYCEQRLWQRGGTLDCVDLWSPGSRDGAGPAARAGAAMAVRRFTHGLMEAGLWAEAFRFASLASYDCGLVLEEWVSDLLARQQDLHAHEGAHYDGSSRYERSSVNTAVQAEWQALLRACAEVSQEANRYMGYRRCVRRALLQHDLEATPPALRAAHRRADPYSALTTLLEVFYGLRKRAAAAVVRARTDSEHEDEEGQHAADKAEGGSNDKSDDNDEQEEEEEKEEQSTTEKNDSNSSNGGSGSGSRKDGDEEAVRQGEAERLTRQAWQVWAEAADIALQLIDEAEQEEQQQYKGTPMFKTRQTHSAQQQQRGLYTAGVLDPVVALARELLRSPSLRQVGAQAPDVTHVAQRLLQRLSLTA